MITTWKFQIDWEGTSGTPEQYNDDGPYDDVTSCVILAEWFLGMEKPYQDVAENSILTMILDNSDRSRRGCARRSMSACRDHLFSTCQPRPEPTGAYLVAGACQRQSQPHPARSADAARCVSALPRHDPVSLDLADQVCATCIMQSLKRFSIRFLDKHGRMNWHRIVTEIPDSDNFSTMKSLLKDGLVRYVENMDSANYKWEM